MCCYTNTNKNDDDDEKQTSQLNALIHISTPYIIMISVIKAALIVVPSQQTTSDRLFRLMEISQSHL